MQRPRLTLFLSAVVGSLFFAGCESQSDYREFEPPSGWIRDAVPPEVLTGGAPVRAVWVLETGDGSDWRAMEGNLILMGYDSRDGKGVRILHQGHANYQKPMLGPDGEVIIFTDWTTHQIYRLNWGAAEPERLGAGYALEVWRDPSGRTWVYAGNGEMDRRGNLESLSRFPLDDPGAVEEVYADKVQGSNFQLSHSGAVAGGMFPAPDIGGVLNMKTLEVSPFGRGCWSSFSPDERRLLSILDGRHRNINIYDTITLERWQVTISSAPGIGGDKAYYPRWTNHSRFFTLAGPIHGTNPMRSEIYLGRFSPDYRMIEAWSRLTSDDRPDIFPDIWIGTPDGAAVSAAPAPATGEDPALPPRVSVDPNFPVSVVWGRLDAATPTPSLEEIHPYDQALAVYRYAVDAHPETGEPGTLYVAHWVIRDRERVTGFRPEVGEEYRLRVVPYAGNPAYEGERVVSTLGEGGEAIYVAVGD